MPLHAGSQLLIPGPELFDFGEVELQQAIRPCEQFLTVKRYEHMLMETSFARARYLDSPIVRNDRYV